MTAEVEKEEDMVGAGRASLEGSGEKLGDGRMGDEGARTANAAAANLRTAGARLKAEDASMVQGNGELDGTVK